MKTRNKVLFGFYEHSYVTEERAKEDGWHSDSNNLLANFVSMLDEHELMDGERFNYSDVEPFISAIYRGEEIELEVGHENK